MTTHEQINRNTAWLSARRAVNEEAGDFLVKDAEVACEPHGVGVEVWLTLTIEYAGPDDGEALVQRAVIQRVRDYLERVERRLR